jgi:general nucleoside transport system ATP-binding protein
VVQPGGAQPEIVLGLRGITKRYPGVVANDGVDFELRRGEVHALLGENGAGKTTLMQILSGLVAADAGEILLRGRPTVVDSAKAAIGHGIGMVHQHFMLVEVMTVAENLAIGAEPRRRGILLDRRAAAARVRALSERFGLAVAPDARIEDLSVGQQQRVEILRALDRGASILILDEPTAVLTAQEARDLFRIVRELTAAGTSVVFISHKLEEVLAVADRITVLRRGRTVKTVPAAGATVGQLARLMVGREVLLRLEKPPARIGAPVLEVTGLHVRDARGLEAVAGVSLSVRAGEIVGLAGVDGNGQAELVEAIAGLRRPESGTVTVGGRDLTGKSPRHVLDAGVAYIAEDRQRRGLVLPFSLAENLALRGYRAPWANRFGLLSRGGIVARAARLLGEYDVRGGGPATLASALSGGNQQKLVVARELSIEPTLLIAAQPTRGVDVGAAEFFHRRLLDQRKEGRGILLVSLELDEILELSDRILVMYEGRIAGEFEPSASEDEVGLAMAGRATAG